ncbi:MAG: transcription antitermination factor NusB, partial [Candidatus Eisenbacteria bacterium]|nr:transcription antitermination factor NusB [Candidatus Eisenbacteria bacterium]
RKGRELVFRALYESRLTGDPVGEVLELSLGKFRLTAEGRQYALRLAESCATLSGALDGELQRLLQAWDPDRLGAVERAVLELAFAELRRHRDVDAKVILDEAVRLAQRYVSPEAGAFVNGLLDPLARRERPGELEEVPPGA